MDDFSKILKSIAFELHELEYRDMTIAELKIAETLIKNGYGEWILAESKNKVFHQKK